MPSFHACLLFKAAAHGTGRDESAEQWGHKVRPGESEVVLLPVEATKLYLDLRPFMNIAPLAVR